VTVIFVLLPGERVNLVEEKESVAVEEAVSGTGPKFANPSSESYVIAVPAGTCPMTYVRLDFPVFLYSIVCLYEVKGIAVKIHSSKLLTCARNERCRSIKFQLA
jgi:hypothetical protein